MVICYLLFVNRYSSIENRNLLGGGKRGLLTINDFRLTKLQGQVSVGIQTNIVPPPLF
jgi:hypothetical protein